jgi:hypothetical protein
MMDYSDAFAVLLAVDWIPFALASEIGPERALQLIAIFNIVGAVAFALFEAVHVRRTKQ